MTTMKVLKRLSWPVVLVSLIYFATLLILDIRTNNENKTLLIILNTAFTGAMPIAVSVIAARAYLYHDIMSALLMSCGIIAFGLGSVIAGLAHLMPGLANINLTLYSLCVLAGSVLHLLSLFLGRSTPRDIMLKKQKMILAMVAIGLGAAVIFLLIVSGLLPPFVDGYTFLRNAVIISAIIFYMISSALYFIRYRQTRMDFFYWYALSLLMISVGLGGVIADNGYGTLASWAGRSCQYLGALLALISMLDVMKNARKKSLPLSAAMAGFFIDMRFGYKNIVEASTDAVVSLDGDFKVFYMNKAAETLFGYQKKSMMRRLFLDLVICTPFSDSIRQDLTDYPIAQESEYVDRISEMNAIDNNGRIFPIEVSVVARKLITACTFTLTIRDISLRRQSEDRISRQNTVLQAINQVYEKSIYCHTANELARECLLVLETVTASQLGLIGEVTEGGMLGIIAGGAGQWQSLGSVADNGESLLTNMPSQHPESVSPEGHPQLDSFLGIPIKRDGKTLGVIGVGNRPDGYTETEKEILEALAPTVWEVVMHKRAEERLRDSEQRFNSFMDASPYVAWVKDNQGRYCYLNKAWSEVVRINIKDALGKTDREIYPVSIVQKFKDNEQKARQANQCIVCVEKTPGPLGDQHWKVARFPFKSISGHSFTGGIALDITEQKKTQTALRLSEAFLHTVVEGTKDPIFLKDREGRMLIANTASSLALGVPIGDMIGKTDIEIFSDKEKAKTVMECDRRIMDTDTAETLEEMLPTPYGQRIYLTTKMPWHNSQGSVTGLFGIAHDITDRKEMEIQLKNQAEELKRKNELITDFFINVSHEFKTPLSILMLGIELFEHSLSRAELNVAEMKDNLGLMKQNSYRLGRLVLNLLDITKIDAGFMQPDWTSINIVGLLRNIIRSTHVYAKKRNISLTFSCKDKERYLVTDSFFVERIMLNLLSNAIKHTPKGGCIDVHLSNADDKVIIGVKDTGAGIPDDKKDIIFDRFRQVNSSLTRSNEGCGIGLALTRGLVEMIGGSITLKNTSEHGSEFTVELSALRNEQPAYVDHTGMHLTQRIEMEFSDIDFG
ncbi:MAG: PAS domain S-box protein [Christensenellales bacterium]|jgi:PAS domain S-box-containing protein